MVGGKQLVQVVDTATAATLLTEMLLHAARLGHPKIELQEMKKKLLDTVADISAP